MWASVPISNLRFNLNFVKFKSYPFFGDASEHMNMVGLGIFSIDGNISFLTRFRIMNICDAVIEAIYKDMLLCLEKDGKIKSFNINGLSQSAIDRINNNAISIHSSEIVGLIKRIIKVWGTNLQFAWIPGHNKVVYKLAVAGRELNNPLKIKLNKFALIPLLKNKISDDIKKYIFILFLVLQPLFSNTEEFYLHVSLTFQKRQNLILSIPKQCI